MTPEFSRPVSLDTIGDIAREVEVEAAPSERIALADRFGVIAIERLVARFRLRRQGEEIMLAGRLSADVLQACVASGAPVRQQIAEDVALRFLPESQERTEEELELDAGDLDIVTYSGGAIDLGEAAAQTAALALDPFPRAADADQALRDAGVLAEEQASPFAKLLDLKDRLTR